MPAAASQPESQDDILAAALAALTAADIPPGEQDHASWPDPDTGRPAELAGLTGRRSWTSCWRPPRRRCRR